MAERLDSLIIGAGPAGLTAAVYLARFRRRILVADTGASRARWIPTSHNLPAFAEGMHGETLLERLRTQAHAYGVQTRHARARALRQDDGAFAVDLESETLTATNVILATAQGRRVAVLGSGDHAAGEALFLRTWAADVALILTRDAALSPDRREALAQLGVKVFHASLESIALEEDGATAVCTEGGRTNHFDFIYAAFGVTPQVKLARDLGARLDESGRLVTDEHMQTSVKGLYAAGDVVRGLNQISVAEGEAAIAATAIHNRLPRNPA
jgi:thioredoxin reductase (NADPH)